MGLTESDIELAEQGGSCVGNVAGREEVGCGGVGGVE